MPTKATIPLSPTTLSILFNDWIALREIMAKITLTRKQSQNATKKDTSFSLLTETQIHDGFYGPYHALIRAFSQAYALISKLRTHLTITQDENIKALLKTSDLNLPKAVKTEINAATLDKLQRKIDELVKEHFKKWEEQIIRWREQLIMQLTMHEIALSDFEIEDLSQPETLSEMLERFIELKLTPPKIKGDAYSFSDFLRCKAILVIHSAFNRQHESRSIEEIQKITKLFKNDFKQMDVEQEQLIDKIHRDLEETTKELF